MKNLKISQKLIFSFLLVIVLAVTIGGVGFYGMDRMNKADDRLYSTNLLSTSYLGKINTEYNVQRSCTRDMALYPSGDPNFKLAFENLKISENNMNELISLYKVTYSSKEDEIAFGKFINAYETDYAAVKSELIAKSNADDQAGAIEVMRTQGAAVQAIITPLLNDCMTINEELAHDSVNANTKMYRTMIVIETIVLAVAVFVAMALAFYISSLISKPMEIMKDTLLRIGTKGDLAFTDAEYKTTEEYATAKDEVGESMGMLLTTVRRLVKVGEALETVAEGDLTADLALLSNEDTMGLSLQKMMNNLNDMFTEIQSSTMQVSTGSKQIANGAQALAQGSTEQASAVEELSSSIGEIATQTTQNADMAKEASQLSDVIKSNAEKGSRQMEQLMQAVKEINDASSSISNVIKVIDNIAFQTNILALNASVEAARAGQHGRGFAVVAEEVRTLAVKSAEMAKDTSSMIENSIEKANLGFAIATETSASLKDIVDGINRSADIVTQIAQSSDEQANAITQINIGIDQVAQVVQQNSATAQESAAASQEMSGQSSILEDLITQFTLRNSNVSSISSRSTSSKKSYAAPDKSYHALGSGDYGKY